MSIWRVSILYIYETLSHAIKFQFRKCLQSMSRPVSSCFSCSRRCKSIKKMEILLCVRKLFFHLFLSRFALWSAARMNFISMNHLQYSSNLISKQSRFSAANNLFIAVAYRFVWLQISFLSRYRCGPSHSEANKNNNKTHSFHAGFGNKANCDF